MHVAARVCGIAEPDEILVSETVRDLVAGSGLRFLDRAWCKLKGLSEARHLFALAPPSRAKTGNAGPRLRCLTTNPVER